MAFRFAAIVSILLSSLWLSSCSRDRSASEGDAHSLNDSVIYGKALLGRVAGAEVNAYRWNDLTTPICSTETSSSVNGTDQAGEGIDGAGIIEFPASCFESNELYVLSVSKGDDIDSDNDQIMDESPVSIRGKLRVLISGSHLLTSSWHVTPLTEALYQSIQHSLEDMSSRDAVLNLLKFLAPQFVAADINADGVVDESDIYHWQPGIHDQVVTNMHMLNGLIDAIYLDENTTLVEVDKTDALLGHLNTQSEATGITVVDDIAFVATRYALLLVDVVDPSKPTLLSSFPVGWIVDFIVIDDVAFVSMGSAGIMRIDVSNVVAPTWLSTIDVNAYQMAAHGESLFFYDRDSDLFGVIDLAYKEDAEPAPIMAQTFDAGPDGFELSLFKILGDRAFVVKSNILTSVVSIFDIDSSRSLELEAEFDVSSYINSYPSTIVADITMVNDVLYLALNNPFDDTALTDYVQAGILFLNLSDNNLPTLNGFFTHRIPSVLRFEKHMIYAWAGTQLNIYNALDFYDVDSVELPVSVTPDVITPRDVASVVKELRRGDRSEEWRGIIRRLAVGSAARFDIKDGYAFMAGGRNGLLSFGLPNEVFPELITGQAVLRGPVIGAQVRVYRWPNGGASPICETRTLDASEVDEAGVVALPADCVLTPGYYYLEVSGGLDIDIDGNGYRDQEPTPIQGVFGGIYTSTDLLSGNWYVSIVTEAYSKLLESLVEADKDLIYLYQYLDRPADEILQDGIDGDEYDQITHEDINLWHPRHGNNEVRGGQPTIDELSLSITNGSVEMPVQLRDEPFYTFLNYRTAVKHVVANVALLSSDGAFQIAVLDDNFAPTIVSSTDVGGIVQDVELVGDRAYLAVNEVGLKVFDVSDFHSPKLIGELPGDVIQLEFIDGVLVMLSIDQQSLFLNTVSVDGSNGPQMLTSKKVASFDKRRQENPRLKVWKRLAFLSRRGSPLEGFVSTIDVFRLDEMGELLPHNSLSNTGSHWKWIVDDDGLFYISNGGYLSVIDFRDSESVEVLYRLSTQSDGHFEFNLWSFDIVGEYLFGFGQYEDENYQYHNVMRVYHKDNFQLLYERALPAGVNKIYLSDEPTEAQIAYLVVGGNSDSRLMRLDLPQIVTPEVVTATVVDADLVGARIEIDKLPLSSDQPDCVVDDFTLLPAEGSYGIAIPRRCVANQGYYRLSLIGGSFSENDEVGFPAIRYGVFSNAALASGDWKIDAESDAHYHHIEDFLDRAGSLVIDTSKSISELFLPDIMDSNPRAIEVNSGKYCVVDDYGVRCWGERGYFDNTVSLGLIKPVAIALGNSHSCVIDNVSSSRDEEPERHVVCSSRNSAPEIITPPEGLVDPVTIAVAETHSCAIGSEQVKCWGWNDSGQIDVPNNLKNPSALALGQYHSCVIDDNDVRCWGSSTAGQMEIPTDIKNPRAIAAGNTHTCVLDDDGVKCWGRRSSTHCSTSVFGKETCYGTNDYGELDLVNMLSNPVSITVGHEHACAIDDSGVVCWGESHQNQLTQIPKDLVNPRLISIGNIRTCVIDDGGVHCWGGNQ